MLSILNRVTDQGLQKLAVFDNYMEQSVLLASKTLKILTRAFFLGRYLIVPSVRYSSPLYVDFQESGGLEIFCDAYEVSESND